MNILCFGDSNTYGYNPKNGTRFDKKTRWTGVLQKILGDEYNIIEEGLSGRTISSDDIVADGVNGLNYLRPCLNSHSPIDLIIIMLGTNDAKERINLTADEITSHLCNFVDIIGRNSICFANNIPKILIVAPVPCREEIEIEPFKYMGRGCHQKTVDIVEKYEKLAKEKNCHFFNPSKYIKASDDDYVHLDETGHKIFAEKIAEKIKNIK